MCQWELLRALVNSCPGLGNSSPAQGRWPEVFTQAVSQWFLVWYCYENDVPLQRLRYMRIGSLVGVRGVGAKPGMFCLHFCQPPGSFPGDTTPVILCSNADLCISKILCKTLAAHP